MWDIIHGGSPSDFPFPAIEPTLKEIINFIPLFSYSDSIKPICSKILLSIQDEIIEMRKNQHYPYEKSLRVCLDFVEAIDYIYRYEQAKEILDTPSEFGVEKNSDNYNNLMKAFNALNQNVTLDGIKNLVDTELNIILFFNENKKNKIEKNHKLFTHRAAPSMDNMNYLTEFLFESKDNLDKLKLCMDEKIFLPQIGDLSVDFLNKIRSGNVFPIGVLTVPVVNADGNRMTPYEFFYHDVFHAKMMAKSLMSDLLDQKDKSISELSFQSQVNIKKIMLKIKNDSSKIMLKIKSDSSKIMLKIKNDPRIILEIKSDSSGIPAPTSKIFLGSNEKLLYSVLFGCLHELAYSGSNLKIMRRMFDDDVMGQYYKRSINKYTKIIENFVYSLVEDYISNSANNANVRDRELLFEEAKRDFIAGLYGLFEILAELIQQEEEESLNEINTRKDNIIKELLTEFSNAQDKDFKDASLDMLQSLASTDGKYLINEQKIEIPFLLGLGEEMLVSVTTGGFIGWVKKHLNELKDWCGYESDADFIEDFFTYVKNSPNSVRSLPSRVDRVKDIPDDLMSRKDKNRFIFDDYDEILKHLFSHNMKPITAEKVQFFLQFKELGRRDAKDINYIIEAVQYLLDFGISLSDIRTLFCFDVSIVDRYNLTLNQVHSLVSLLNVKNTDNISILENQNQNQNFNRVFIQHLTVFEFILMHENITELQFSNIISNKRVIDNISESTDTLRKLLLHALENENKIVRWFFPLILNIGSCKFLLTSSKLPVGDYSNQDISYADAIKLREEIKNGNTNSFMCLGSYEKYQVINLIQNSFHVERLELELIQLKSSDHYSLFCNKGANGEERHNIILAFENLVALLKTKPNEEISEHVKNIQQQYPNIDVSIILEKIKISLGIRTESTTTSVLNKNY